MSFTNEVKAELAALPIGGRALLMAESYGMVLPCVDSTGTHIRLQTESADAAKRLAMLCEGLCGAPVELSMLGGGYLAEVERGEGAVQRVLQVLDIPTGVPALRLGRALLEDADCVTAFLRGLFLSAGTASDPEKGYRLELVLRQHRLTDDLEVLLQELQLPPARTTRRLAQVLYYKSASRVEEILRSLGAARSADRLAQVRGRRAITNEINRQQNSSIANIKRMAQANALQNAALQSLQESGVLDTLPKELQQVAQARLANPEATLRELSGLLPGLSRSTVDRRLRRLVELAQACMEETQ